MNVQHPLHPCFEGLLGMCSTLHLVCHFIRKKECYFCLAQ